MNTFLFHVSVYISSVIYCTVKFFLGLSLQRQAVNNNCTDDLLWNEIQGGAVIHRGGIPENTVRAFHKSKLGGARAVEVDLQFTKDGHPVLFHDWTVDRVSDRSGHLHDMTLHDIQSLNVTAGQSLEVDNLSIHHPATVPTLYEAIDALKELDMYMFLELKDPSKQTITTILQLFENDSSLCDKIAVVSFFPHLLYKIKQQNININTGLIMKANFLTNSSHITITAIRCLRIFQFLLFRITERAVWILLTSFVWKAIGVNFLLPHKEDILKNRFDVKYFHNKNGMKLLTWTVNSSKEKEYFDTILKIPYINDYEI